MKFYIGDVRNRQSIDVAMRGGVDYIFSAAALKQVPSCEFFPMQAVETNIVGTNNVLESAIAHELRDYKFFCFDGKVKALFIATGRQSELLTFDYFDENFIKLPFLQSHPNSKEIVEKPKTFEKMKQIAANLSEGLPHVRVDLYEVNGKVYFGEMTFYHYGGFVAFHPDEWDYKFGEWLKLPLREPTNKIC